MLSIGRSAHPVATVTTGGWSELLASEERHVAAQGFGAGVLVVSFIDELVRHVDADIRALTEAAILGIIDRHLGWTDRTSMIDDGRLGVVTVPIDGPLALSRRARELHRDLRACGLEVDVSYSLRRRSGGLHAAAARADAALDNAISRRRD